MSDAQGAMGDLTAKVAAGETLSSQDRDLLVATRDLLALGMLADEARRRRHGDRVTFVRVARMPCRPRQGEPSEVPPTAGEIRIDGPIEDVVQAAARIREVLALSDGQPVSAFTLGELDRWSSENGIPLGDILRQLREAGLELVAEAELDRLERSLEACEAVATSGLTIARVTMKDPPPQGVLSLFAELRSLQSALGSLRAFAPLPRTLSALAPSTGYDDVKQVALARLLVDNVPTIQVDWSLYGPKLAQVALSFGADDVDAVSPVNDAGAEGWRRSALEEIRRNVAAASLVPVERNGRFELL